MDINNVLVLARQGGLRVRITVDAINKAGVRVHGPVQIHPDNVVITPSGLPNQEIWLVGSGLARPVEEPEVLFDQTATMVTPNMSTDVRVHVEDVQQISPSKPWRIMVTSKPSQGYDGDENEIYMYFHLLREANMEAGKLMAKVQDASRASAILDDALNELATIRPL